MSELCSAYECGCVLVHFICLMDLPRCEFSLAHLVHNTLTSSILLTGHNLSVTTCLVKEKCLFLSTLLELVLQFVYISCLLVSVDHQFISPTPAKEKKNRIIFIACCSQDGQVIPMFFYCQYKMASFSFLHSSTAILFSFPNFLG